MWIRSDLKMKAKQAFKKNYWVAVVVSLILAVILASGGSSGNNDKDNLSISRYTQSVGEDGNVAVTGVTYALNVFEPLRVLTAPLRAMMGLVTVSMKVLLVVLLIILKILIFNGLEVGGRGFYIENTYSNPGIGRIPWISYLRAKKMWDVSHRKGKYFSDLCKGHIGADSGTGKIIGR